MTKIVLLGDCHNKFNTLDKILSNEYPFDFFIATGDIGKLNLITSEDWSIIKKWQFYGYSVLGNHDDIEIFNRLDINSNICGLTVVGLNGMIKSRNFIKDTHNNVSFREVLYASHLNDVDILVTHQPPTGIHKNIGESVYTELVHYMVPRLYISGHIHKYGLKFYLNTFLISLPLINKGYIVVYFDGRELKNIEIVLKKGKKVIRI